MHKYVFSPVFSAAAWSALVLLLSVSCGVQRKTSPNAGNSVGSIDAPTASEWRRSLRGSWVLNSVERENIPAAYTVKMIFGEAPIDCFVRSVWHLPGGSHRGSISFTSGGRACDAGMERTIVWSVYDGTKEGAHPQFQFKKIFPGEKASEIRNGYRLDLSYSDGQSLVMRMPVPLDKGTGHLVFNFSRSETN